jgi:ABC-2 type transport system ATP-binding protein
LIVVEGITKYYSQHKALDEVSFTIGTGEIAGFLGLNGAGKTTMLKILAGLMLPSSGQFSIDGTSGQGDNSKGASRIGFLPDRPPLYDDMTVRKMLAYAGRLNGVPPELLANRVSEVLEMTHLSDESDSLVGWLSHGYRQRLGIAQAIVHRPSVVILDEPISGLDPIQIVEMRKLVKTIGEEHTIILSSHILSEISQTCDRILVLSEGQIVAQGTEHELTDAMTSSRVRIVARGDQHRLPVLLEKVPRVSAEEVIQTGDGVLQLEFSAPEMGDREALVKMLVEDGFSIREVNEVDTGLEDVFIHLTGTGGSAGTGGAP